MHLNHLRLRDKLLVSITPKRVEAAGNWKSLLSVPLFLLLLRTTQATTDPSVVRAH